MRFRPLWACVLASTLLSPLVVRGEHTRYWKESDAAEFEKGTAKGVAIRSDGRLAPAPQFTQFSDPNVAYLWELRLDSRGRLYAAGGSDAKVLRFDDSGKGTTVFEAPELAAQAIAFDAKDNLYVGTSPDGKVYKVTPEGQKSVFFEPKSKYIWALAVDSQGIVFVATGDKGKVFAVTPGGLGKLFYQSEERHARSLAFDAKGNLLLGTEPDGFILRVEVIRNNLPAGPAAGAVFVIYETNKKEVTSLLRDASGNLYAASIGEKAHVPGGIQPMLTVTPPPAVAPVTAQGATVTQAQPQAALEQPPINYPFFASATGGAEVVKISPDGSPESLWTSREDLVFALGLSSLGKLLLGTGNKGAIFSLEGDTLYSTIAKSASAQVTSFVAAPGGKTFVATSNPGKIFTLGPGYQADGSFESDTFDAKIFSHWGRLTWWAEHAATRGRVAFYVRSGNTSNPENNWSAWAGPYKNAEGETVSCPPARFVQWKAVFLATDDGGAPDISWVSLAYQRKNVAPVLEAIEIQDPNIRVQGFAAQAGGPGNPSPVSLRIPQRPGGAISPALLNANPGAKPQKFEVPPQGFQEKGYQSVLWAAHDDNDDDLTFTIYFRGEGERSWRLLKDKITQNLFSWDTAAMPDGAYYLKIVASDSPSNPLDQALTDARESDRFEIVNTPPRVENLRADAGGAAVKVSFEGISPSAAIAHARYSLDAGEWQIVLPEGLLSDDLKESYQIQLPDLSPGEHTIAVEISDRFDNKTAAKVTFSTAARAPR
jgi:sugar lactone lactonase YvrE